MEKASWAMGLSKQATVHALATYQTKWEFPKVGEAKLGTNILLL